MYGRIGHFYFVQGFVIVMASVDPQTFKAFGSTIYITILVMDLPSTQNQLSLSTRLPITP